MSRGFLLVACGHRGAVNNLIIDSLSKGRFFSHGRQPKLTSFPTCLHTITLTFIFISIFSLVETISLKICARLIVRLNLACEMCTSGVRLQYLRVISVTC